MIILVVEATEITQHAEAPISFTILAYYQGFQVLVTRRMGEQPILSQIPGVVALIKKLEESGFEPVRPNLPAALNAPESKDVGTESQTPLCTIHNIPMVKRKGQYGDFWACPRKLSDGTWCKEKPPK